MFCLVFGIQEGELYDWGTIAGPVTVWSLIISGLVLLTAFVLWQRLNRAEPLLPLRLFRDRNFSLANTSITAMGFSITTMALPLMLYAQNVRGLSPTQAALLLTPMAVVSGVLAPFVGRFVQRNNPKFMAVLGFAGMSASLFWLGAILTPDVPLWLILLPVSLLGFSSAGIWAPVSLTATRNLDPSLAGAGSGVYNTTRQVGAVLGSSAIAAMMQARLSANLGGGSADEGSALPQAAQAGYALSMGQALYLPATVILIGLAAALFYARPQQGTVWTGETPKAARRPAQPVDS
jgi:MFS family permease